MSDIFYFVDVAFWRAAESCQTFSISWICITIPVVITVDIVINVIVIIINIIITIVVIIIILLLLLYYYYWYHYYYYHLHHHHHHHHQHYWYHCLLLNSKARTGRRSSLDTTHRACSDADEHTHEPYDDARASKATAHSALADSRLGRAPFASAYLEPVFGQKLSVCFCTY